MRDLPRLCEYLHLPAQSGSNDVLKRMKRQYTVEEYLDLVDRARDIVPGITLASDFIVGFCGETEADHEATLSLVERVAYKNIFMFKYSERPRTAADRRLPDDVPDDTKGRRLTDLAQLQKRLSMQHHQALVGKTVEVLVEGYSKAAIQAQEAEQARGQEVDHDRSGSEQARARTKRYAKRGEGTIAPWKRADQLTGRTRGDEIAVFTGPASLIGQTIRLTVNAATALTLHGELVADSPNLHSLSVTS
jgi:tRNA-2-methylthio-N6-dimethylallyladenosine synthase